MSKRSDKRLSHRLRRGVFTRTAASQKKALCLCLCVCIFTLLFSACGKSNAAVLRIPLSVVPTSYDPQIANGIDSENIINNCFEGLVRIDENGNIIKGVANSWDISSDGLTYTFNLRSDAEWRLSKNLDELLGEDYEKTFDTAVTAFDFEFALKRAVSPDTKAPLANTLSPIKGADSILSGSLSPDALGVEAIDRTTLKITLSRPSVSFLSVLASPVCMPCNEAFFNATAGRYGLEARLVLCNGPYYVGTVDEQVGVTIYSSDSYKGDYAPLAGTVRFLLPSSMVNTASESDTTTTEAATAAKNVSVFSLLLEGDGGFDAGVVTERESKDLASVFTVNKYKNTIKVICFNTRNETLSNSDIRLAMVHSANLEELRKNEPMAEGIVPSSCGLSPGVSYRAGSNIISPPSYDMALAAQRLSAAVNSLSETDSGADLSLSVKFVCLSEDEVAIKKMLQSWQKTFGVSLSVTLVSFDTQEELDTAVSAGSYDIAYTKITASEFLAADFLNRFSAVGGNNIINLASADYDRLLNAVYNAPDEAALLATTKACEEYLVSGGFILPVCQCDSYLAVKETANGLSVRPSGTVYALYA